MLSTDTDCSDAPPLSVSSPLHPTERERSGVGCKNRPVAAQEEQNSDRAKWLPGGTSGTNRRRGPPSHSHTLCAVRQERTNSWSKLWNQSRIIEMNYDTSSILFKFPQFLCLCLDISCSISNTIKIPSTLREIDVWNSVKQGILGQFHCISKTNSSCHPLKMSKLTGLVGLTGYQICRMKTM